MKFTQLHFQHYTHSFNNFVIIIILISLTLKINKIRNEQTYIHFHIPIYLGVTVTRNQHFYPISKVSIVLQLVLILKAIYAILSLETYSFFIKKSDTLIDWMLKIQHSTHYTYCNNHKSELRKLTENRLDRKWKYKTFDWVICQGYRFN